MVIEPGRVEGATLVAHVPGGNQHSRAGVAGSESGDLVGDRLAVLGIEQLIQAVEDDQDPAGLPRPDAGGISLIVPTLAIAEAQAVMGARTSEWDFIHAFRGIRAQALSEHDAIAIGTAARPVLQRNPAAGAAVWGPLMIAQVVHEATELGGVIVSATPAVYADIDVVVTGLDS